MRYPNAIFLTLAGGLLGACAIVDEPGRTKNASARIEALEARVAELEAHLEKGVASAERKPDPTGKEYLQSPRERAQALDRSHAAQITGTGPRRVEASPSNAQTAQRTTTPSDRPGQRRAVDAALELAQESPSGLLLASGEASIEPSLTYAYTSSDVLAIDGFTVLPVLIVGEVVSERRKQHSVIAGLQGRLGLPWDTEVSVYAPYRYGQEEVFVAGQGERNSSINGVGDVEITLSKQWLFDAADGLDLLTAATWKTRTGGDPFANRNRDGELQLGTGFDGARARITLAKVLDPAVVYGSLAYTANLPDDKPVGRIDPGDSIEYSVGTALALSRSTSLSFGFLQRYTDESALDGEDLGGTSLVVANLLSGLSYKISPSVSLEFNLSAGLTEDSPDFETTISVPIKLGNLF